MAKKVLLDVRVFVGGVDLSGQSNKVEIDDPFEEREVTNFRSGGAKEFIAGLEGPELAGEGQWEAGDPSKVDDAMWATRRELEPWSVAPDGSSDLAGGTKMYLGQAVRTSASLWGSVGDVAGWTAQAKGSGPMVQGYCVHPSGVPRTATGSGTAYQLGEVGSGQTLHANLHVLSVAGTGTPSITVTLQSDNASGFSSPTTRITFGAKTAAGSYEHRQVAGPFAGDQYWRVGYTISGSSPSFLFLVSMGIQ